MSYWKTPAFMALQQAWYQRLEAEGFRDAEEMVGGEMMLKQCAEHPYRGADLLAIESKEAYYSALRRWVQESQFDTEIDRMIMTMLAEGSRPTDIQVTLNSIGIRRPPRFQSESRRCRESIRLTIRKYERRWGIRDDEKEAS